MKKIGFMLVLVVMTLNVFSQAKNQKADSSSVSILDIKELPKPKYQLILSSPLDAKSGMITEQNLIIEGDTIAAVLDLIRGTQEKSELLYAAENILQYLSYDGKVSDLKKYQAAVARYKSLSNAINNKNKTQGK